MTLYYIANARMPTEKAHGIQIAKMCEAFVEAGVKVILVAPKRAKNPPSLQKYYELRVPVNTIYLPALDLYTFGRLGYLISSLSFMISYTFFIFQKKRKGEDFILYTVDMDKYSSSALALFKIPLFSEMHGSKPATFAQKILFKRLKGVIAINKIIVNELQKNLPDSRVKYIVEPNGVDLSRFMISLDKREARARLGLPLDEKIVLYAGRFFAWKGLEIIPQAANLTPSIRWQLVGGVEADFVRLVKRPSPQNLFFAGDRPHQEMCVWFKAADALLVLGTIRDHQSYWHTSPMKLFEYLASDRPIVASRTPAISEIVNDKQVVFYEPDNDRSLAQAVERAITDHKMVESLSSNTRNYVTKLSWSMRAQRIIKFIYESSK